MAAEPKPIWPDFSIDNRAWELAKVALGADAPTSELAQRAQEIKVALSKPLPK
jgi:hypothetical protein